MQGMDVGKYQRSIQGHPMATCLKCGISEKTSDLSTSVTLVLPENTTPLVRVLVQKLSTKAFVDQL